MQILGKQWEPQTAREEAFWQGAVYNLQSPTDATDGRITTGGFITFAPNDILSFHSQTVFYDQETRQLSRREDGQPPNPGQIFTTGVAKELIAEFFVGHSDRAIDAFGRGTPRLIGFDATTDASTARKAIEFAMRYATLEDKASLGEPIDIAVLRRGSQIRWIARKNACYKLDEPPPRNRQ